MSPAVWPYSGHTNGPHHITPAARNLHSLGKRGKKRQERAGRWGKKSGGNAASQCWVEGLEKHSQILKTKFTTEGQQQGLQESVGEERENKKGEGGGRKQQMKLR